MSAHRLLIVEDDDEIAAITSRIARDLGFEVEITSGYPMKAAYRRLQPEIIILDIVMPEMDGLEVLQFLRDQGSEAHIILLSGSPETYRRIAQNMGMGAELHIEANLSKPFRTEDLRLVLEKARRALPPAALRRHKHSAEAIV